MLSPFNQTRAFPWQAEYLAKIACPKAVPKCELSHAVAPLEELAERNKQIEIQHSQYWARPQQQQIVNGLHSRKQWLHGLLQMRTRRSNEGRNRKSSMGNGSHFTWMWLPHGLLAAHVHELWASCGAPSNAEVNLVRTKKYLAPSVQMWAHQEPPYAIQLWLQSH